ncbi:hypothetical protein P7J55_03885 [Streptococcus suis]|uniref:hypothetical protein n=1 Tax=Streptococcus suis TaxID=1307 RepID=UPI0037050D45
MYVIQKKKIAFLVLMIKNNGGWPINLERNGGSNMGSDFYTGELENLVAELQERIEALEERVEQLERER